MKKRQPKIKFDKVILRVGRLTIRPGDFLVLKTNLMLDKDQTMALRDRVDEQFKNLGVKTIVLTCGLSIAVLRKEIAEELAK